MMVSSVITNFGSYVFHLLMGRSLGPIDYGLLESLISLTYYLSVPIAVLNIAIVKYVSQANKDNQRVADFIRVMVQKSAGMGLLILMIFFLTFPWLNTLLKIDSFWLFGAIGLYGYLGIFSTIFSGSLQGMMAFTRLSLISMTTIWIKVGLAITLVAFGWGVGGVVGAMLFSLLLSLGWGWYFVRKKVGFHMAKRVSPANAFQGMGTYMLAAFFSNLALTSFFTVDIILARHFLSPVQAGQYAALSVLGKIIYFASSPIAMVMFPLVSSKQAKGESHKKTFWLSFVCVVALSLVVSSSYFLFPRLMIKLLFGSGYLEVASFLGYFAVFVSFYSITALFANYFLSLGRIKTVVLPLTFSVLQILLINLWHQNIEQILLVNILVMAFLSLAMFLVYLYDNHRPKVLINPAINLPA